MKKIINNHKINSCITKIRLPEREAKTIALERRINYYKCKYCERYHLTSKK